MKCKEIQLFSASNVTFCWGGGGVLFLDNSFSHTCPAVAYKARLDRLYAFQSAGGSPVLTVDFLCSQAVWFNFLPLYPCLPCVCLVCFLSLVDNSNTNTAQALKWKKGTIMMYKKTVREFEV